MSKTTADRKRDLERAAKEEPLSALDAARLGSDQVRLGQGRVAKLKTLEGEWVYVESLGMNYRGILQEVVPDANMQPGDLWFEPLVRTGEWDDEPVVIHDETLPGPQCMQYQAVITIGRMPLHWPRVAPPMGRRNERSQAR